MDRPRAKIDLEIIRQLRKGGLGWHTIARRYYSQTRQHINWMTMRRGQPGSITLTIPPLCIILSGKEPGLS